MEFAYFQNTMRVLLTALVCLLTLRLAAQAEDPLALLQTDLQTPNAVQLAKWFNEDVEVGIDGEKASYPRDQAEIVVNDYFRKHPGKGFTILHQASDNDQMKYLVGRYYANDGPVKVYILMSKEHGKFQISLLDFSKEIKQ